jgi:hypothetical protein
LVIQSFLPTSHKPHDAQPGQMGGWHQKPLDGAKDVILGPIEKTPAKPKPYWLVG